MGLSSKAWSAQLTTEAGMKLDIRSASPDDQQQVLDFLNSLEAQDLRFRFLGAVNPSEALARMLTLVDHINAENLLAFDANDGRLAATAMVVAEPSPGCAEIAVVIRSDLRHRGIGRALLRHACDFARARGFRRVDCVELSDNRDFVVVEQEFGFQSRTDPGDTTLTILSKKL
jgi:GNAT superfamily N-acetyltransferase